MDIYDAIEENNQRLIKKWNENRRNGKGVRMFDDVMYLGEAWEHLHGKIGTVVNETWKCFDVKFLVDGKCHTIRIFQDDVDEYKITKRGCEKKFS